MFILLAHESRCMDSQKGLAYAYLTALVSGIAVFVNSFGVLSTDPTAFTFLKNVLVAAILVSIGFALKSHREFLSLTRRQILLLAISGIIGGGIAFVLYFSGVALLSGAVASFLYRLVFIFSICTGILLLKEKFDWKIALGALAVLAGNFIILGGAALTLSDGVMLILAASALWALDYAISRMALLTNLSTITVASAHMGIGAMVIFLILALEGKAGMLLSLSPASLGWVAIGVALLTLFTTLWYSALKHAPLISCTAILTLGGPVSALLAYALAGKPLALQTAAGFFLIAAGVIFTVGYSESLLAFRWLRVRLAESLPWTR